MSNQTSSGEIKDLNFDESQNLDSGKTTVRQSCSSREFISESAQQLVADINDKRKRDAELLEEFKKDIEIHMGSCVMKVQTSLYNTYDSTSKEFDGKLQELADVINRIEKLESELIQFKKSLMVLCKGLQDPLTAEV